MYFVPIQAQTSIFGLNKKRKIVESATDEFRRYLAMPGISEDADPLLWWKVNAMSFPNLSGMARDYLAIPGTEAAAEREFSKGRRLITFERCSLGPNTIQAIQCLKSWM